MAWGIVNGRAVNDKGEVAVLYSPCYGTGWMDGGPADVSEEERRRRMFCPEVVAATMEEMDNAALEELANRLFPDWYNGGAENLRITWLAPGTEFRHREYDGSEWVELKDHTNWDRV